MSDFRLERLKALLKMGTISYEYDTTWKEASCLPVSWLDDAIEYFIKQGMKISIYSQQLQIKTSTKYDPDSVPDYLSKYNGTILTIDSWIEWVNVWWSIYYVLDDGSEIYAHHGSFIEKLIDNLVRGPVLMVTQDNGGPRTTEEAKTKKFPIDKRKLIGYWVSLDDFIPANFENISRPNPYQYYPGKNRRRKSKGSFVNFTKLIRGDFDTHGVGILYHIKIFTGKRFIYKVGLTKTSVRQRYSGDNIPEGWTLEILNEVSGQYPILAIYEQAALVDNRQFIRIEEEFAGKSECRGKPFDLDWEKIRNTSLDEAKIIAKQAQYRSFI